MAGKQPIAQKLTYDLALWLFNLMLDIFFREVRPRGAHRIPKEGPVIFVVAPHVNQVQDLFFYCVWIGTTDLFFFFFCSLLIPLC